MSVAAQTANVLRLYWAQERSTFQFALFNSFILPATVAYIGSRLIQGSIDEQRFWMAGSIALGLGMGGLAQVGFAVLTDRFMGRFDLIRTLPVAKLAYYSAHIFLAVAEAILLVVVGLVIFSLLGIAAVTPGGVMAALLCGVCAGSAIGGLGAVMASRARSFDSGNTTVAIAAIGLAAASPVFYQLERLPLLLQPLALLSPFTHIAPLLRAVIGGAPLPLHFIVSCVAIAVVYNLVSYRSLQWHE